MHGEGIQVAKVEVYTGKEAPKGTKRKPLLDEWRISYVVVLQQGPRPVSHVFLFFLFCS